MSLLATLLLAGFSGLCAVAAVFSAYDASRARGRRRALFAVGSAVALVLTLLNLAAAAAVMPL